MKIIAYTIRGAIILMTLCVFAQGSFAYAPLTTHAGLTQEIVSFYEIHNGYTFDAGTSELLIQGSIDEDTPSTRSLNHFYDPIYGTGLNDGRPALRWATDELSGNEFTWSAGIDAYARGDERLAMVTLGHILHLIEDASVPDHTRNDPHMGDGGGGFYTGFSPYEHWTNNYKDRSTLSGAGKQFADEGLKMAACNAFEICFKDIAFYSNGNFFSRDTIGSYDYINPEVTGKDEKYGYGTDLLTRKKIKLYRIFEKDEGERGVGLIYSDDYTVISDYFDRLAPQAVSVGARVIDLFLKEAKSARIEYLRQEQEAQDAAVQEQLALHERLKDVGIFREMSFGLTDIFFSRPASAVSSAGSRIASAALRGFYSYVTVLDNGVYTTKLVTNSGERASIAVAQKVESLAVSGIAHTVEFAQKAGNAIAVGASASLSEAERLVALAQNLALAQKILEKLAMEQSVGEVAGASTTVETDTHQAVRSVGGRVIFLADASVGTSPAISETTSSATTSPLIDVSAPDAPVVISPADGESVATTSITMSGTTEAGAIVALSWISGGATIVFETRATSSSEWSGGLLLPVGTTTVGVVAIDDAGNISSTTFRTVVVMLPAQNQEPPPLGKGNPRVIFNEIAWSGTDASPEDEWIELYNSGDGTADLAHYNIEIDAGSGVNQISIPLSGTLDSGSHAIVRKNVDALNIRAPNTLVLSDAALSLPDAGARLTLIERGEGTEEARDHVPFCVDWCRKGGNGLSLERWKIETSGDDQNNWETNDGNFENGVDRNGDPIHGTPGARNSLNYRLSLSDTILGMQSFAKGLGAYVIFTTLTIPAGSSLSLGAGTVVKWETIGEPSLVVNGSFIAMGTTQDPIVFTSLYDDAIGGDTMNDGSTSPAIPLMRGIDIVGASSSMALYQTEFHYANDAISLNNGASSIIDSTTIKDGRNGILASQSTLSSVNLTLNHVENSGISISNGAIIALASTTITNALGVGISLSAESRLVADDLIVDNVGVAIRMEHSYATITNASIENSSGRGARLSKFSVLAISSSTITNTQLQGVEVNFSTLRADDLTLVDNQRGIFASNGDVVIHNSTIEGNTLSGITNATPLSGAPVDATGNYWGSADGPTLPNMASGSAGDSVSAGVLTMPFLATPPE